MIDFGFYNMDCMEGMKEFPDKYFDLAIVDPPYGGITQGGYMQNKMGDGPSHKANYRDYHLALWQYNKPSIEYFNELQRVSCNQIIWGGNYYSSMLKDSQCWLVWDKEKPDGVSYADVELAWTSFDQASRIFHFMWNGMLQGDMKNKEIKIHPTQKPVKLYTWLLSNFAEDGFKILDTHVGSASSLIACHRMGFDYVGFEIDEEYYRQASKRLKDELDQISILELMRRLP